MHVPVLIRDGLLGAFRLAPAAPDPSLACLDLTQVSLRRIDLDVAANGFVCSDRVYSLHALRRTATAGGQFAITPQPFGASIEPAP